MQIASLVRLKPTIQITCGCLTGGDHRQSEDIWKCATGSATPMLDSD